MDQASRGAAALSAGNYTGAVAEFTSAISSQPQAVDYYIKRSTAYQRASPPALDLALQDAETAVALAYKRAKRELIAEAQLRRVIALFALSQHEAAHTVLQYVKKFNEKDKSIPIWTKKIEEKLKNAKTAEKVASTERQTREIPKLEVRDNEPTPEKNTEDVKKLGPFSDSQNAPQNEVVRTPTNKIRHEWYQNSDNVYITLLAKGVPRDKANIEINERSVRQIFRINKVVTSI